MLAAFRQLQCISHIISTSSEATKDLDSFILPAGVDVSPVDETETYCIESGGAIDTAWKVKKDRTGCKQVFENHETTQDFNLLTCGLDQGSSGAAGMAYIMFALDMLAWVSFDKIHRLEI